MATKSQGPAHCAVARVVFGAISLIGGACPSVVALDPALDVSQYAHTAWKIREGFTKGAIKTITQTPDGYIWFGTEFGLYRFDGVRAVLWQPGGNANLPSSNIRKLLVARDGTLWIGTHKGLASWKDGRLTQYAGLPGQEIDSLLEDRDGTIWAGVETVPTWRLCAIQHGRAQCYGEKDGLGLGVGSLFEDKKGNLWAGTGTGLWRWKPGAPQLIPLSGPVSEIHGLIEDRDGELLFTTRAGIMRLVDGKVATYPLTYNGPRFNPHWLLRDTNGGLWIGTIDQGLLHVHDGRTDRFSQADGLSSDFVEDLFEDREGNVWVCTNSGLDRFRDFAVTMIPVKQGLAESYVESVLPSADGSVWLGTRHGLDRWNEGGLTLYRKRRVPIAGLDREIVDVGLPDDFQASLYEDHRGRIWAFSRSGAAYLEKGRFIPVPGMPGGYAHCIAEDTVGDLWICLDQGLFHILPGRTVEQIPWGSFGFQGLALAMGADASRGGVWLGFSEGGVAYFKDGQLQKSYSVADGLGKGRISSVQVDQDGILWVGTEGGLSRITEEHVVTLSSKNGLPCDSVHDVIEDDRRSLWLYMDCGLVRVTRPEWDAWATNPKGTIQATIFDNSDGLRSTALAGALSPRVGKSSDGRLWYVSEGNVFVVDPNGVDRRPYSFNKLQPPVHIEQIIADGKTYDPKSELRLPPRVRDLAIDYTALSFVAPERVRFRFRLEGQDRDWREVLNVRQVQYSNLGPGTYRFRVTACNNSGVWNEAGTFVDFSIAPAYWQTNWFRAACVGAILAILWAAYQLRVRALHQRHTLLERHEGEISALNEQLMKAQEEERMRIAGELHDGILQRITSVSLELATATIALPADSEPKAEVREVEKKLIEVGVEIRQLSHKLHPAVLNEKGLPTALSAYCEEFSEIRGIPVVYTADENVDKLSPGAALCIYRIAQEALGNVAKHANARHVAVRLTRSNGTVCLLVSDDGIGFDPSRTETFGGLGLINMRERVRQLNGTFAFESEPGRGTIVKAEVPFRPAS
ncbi:MAG TPA: two-component regulator propeller domain-containing protein [Candidatus Eisenbacteria bacterium]|nr:two-component regulator propeller domain-containing protein [Candidatus Eisenbacteria bacterium]